jgi:hypothetical protein
MPFFNDIYHLHYYNYMQKHVNYLFKIIDVSNDSLSIIFSSPSQQSIFIFPKPPLQYPLKTQYQLHWFLHLS